MPHAAVIILAFGFGSLSMLGWLAAASAPLLIHLWNRRRYREHSWAAIDFLLEALKKNARRLQLEQWLLLAVRTLIILLVVLALAEPYLDRLGQSIAPGEPTHRVIVLDGSFSMAFRPTDESRFDRAKELAAAIAEESQRGDGLSLVLMSAPPRAIIASPAFEPSAVLDELDNLAIPHGRADVAATLAKVTQIIEQTEREHPRLKQREVYWLTDLQRNTWLNEQSPQVGSRVAELSRQLSQQAALTVIDLGQSSSDNVAVVGLSTDTSPITVARDTSFDAQIRNYGRQRRASETVEFYVDGRRVGEQIVELDAGGEALTSFSYRFESGDEHTVEARVSGDLLDVDNHRWLAVPVKQSLRVLCVNGKPAGAGFRGATDYLAVALSPSGDAPQSLVRPVVVPESALVETDLTAFDCIFLSNVGQFTTNEAMLLGRYLRQGGAIVFFLGDQVVADSYNRSLFDEAETGGRLLPARLGETVPEGEYFFDPLDYEHPVVREFRGRENAGLLTTPIRRYVRLELPEQSTAKVALAFLGGDPAIVEQKVDRGRVMLVATSADTSWTSLPVWPSYVPIVHNLLKYGLRGQQSERNVLAGRAIGDVLPPAARDTSVMVETPAGEQRVVRFDEAEGLRRWQFVDTDRSGIYAAQFGAPAGRRELYAVNVDASEGDLAKLTAEELENNVWPEANFVLQTTWQNFDQRTAGEVSRREVLHRWLLYGALGLLLMETLMAWRFGSRMA